jgi:hypothetical protein
MEVRTGRLSFVQMTHVLGLNRLDRIVDLDKVICWMGDDCASLFCLRSLTE